MHDSEDSDRRNDTQPRSDPRPRAAPDLGREVLRQFLLRGWMTHDAMWFASALEEGGIALANRLNQSAIRSMAPLEVKRLRKALGIDSVHDFDELQAFLHGAMGLLAGDYFDYEWKWPSPNTLIAHVHRCFAHEGISRYGDAVLSEYECGCYDRINAWIDELGISYATTPEDRRCLMYHRGACVREIRFSLDASTRAQRES